MAPVSAPLRQQVIGLDDGEGILYVAASGPAYPVQITQPEGSGHQQLDFLEYNEPVELKAPTDAVDLTEAG